MGVPGLDGGVRSLQLLFRAVETTVRPSSSRTGHQSYSPFSGYDRERNQLEAIRQHRSGSRPVRKHYRCASTGPFPGVDAGMVFRRCSGVSIRALEIVVLVLAVRYWLIGVLTLGDFILLRSYLSQLTENVRQMGQDIRRIYEAMADANEMTEILLAPHEIVDEPGAATLTVPKGVVEFRNVQFSYSAGSNLVLRDFRLGIKSGERVGIVGPSGGGKSTVLKLLARLHEVRSGHILI